MAGTPTEVQGPAQATASVDVDGASDNGARAGDLPAPEPASSTTTARPRAASPTKRPARKSSKSGGRKTPAKKTTPRKPAVAAQQAKYPRHAVERALRIPQAIFDQNAGKPTTLADAAKFATGGSANGAFQVEVSSSKKYGFLKSDKGSLVPMERARSILYPQSETDRITGLREAVLEAPDFAQVYSHYRGGEPARFRVLCQCIARHV